MHVELIIFLCFLSVSSEKRIDMAIKYYLLFVVCLLLMSLLCLKIHFLLHIKTLNIYDTDFPLDEV